MDEQGLQTEALADLLAALPADQRPKLLYTVPNFSNPRGTLLAAERREALVQLARQHGFWVVEDDPYGELRFDDARRLPKPCLAPCAPRASAWPSGSNPVIYLSSLSKTVAPRCAWAGCWPTRRCCAAARWPSKRPTCAPRR
jgi:DNA-binding transcriptional MocR family regulator